MTSLRLFSAAATILALGCSGGGDDGPSEPGNTNPTVSVQNNSFAPGTVSVPVNGTVTWVWNSGGVAHNVTFQDATSGDLTSGSYSRPFDTAGSFSYSCTIHAAQGMVGVVSVGGGTGGGGDDGGGYP